MVIVKDDFLDDATFSWLCESSKKVSSKLKQGLEQNGVTDIYRSHHKKNWNTCYYDLNGDPTIPSVKLGRDISPILNKITDLVKEENSSYNIPKLNNVFHIFSINGYETHKHRDQAYSVTSEEVLKSTFKGFIFCHQTWKEEWGGHLCFNGSENLPKPNRLVIFSMEEAHWVNLVKDAEVERSIFGARWGSDY
jgi:hypothetical protein